ncbi:MAG: GGDEF domain-containing protein, partial [Gemmatimonadales bacterium]
NAMAGQEEFRHLAEIDPLTEAFNRRALLDRLVKEIERTERYGTALALLMVDLDNFKQVNDTYGHLAGDRVLQQLVTILRREQRAVDMVARYGGEEFVVVLPETGLPGARNFAERILRRVSGHEFADGRPSVRVTVSIGIATFPDERVKDHESLLRLADENLYKAKRDGRNRYRE